MCVCHSVLDPSELTSSQEKGVFAALSDGSLRALKVYVHPSQVNRAEVIEKYTFNVKYLSKDGGEQAIAGIELNGNGIPSVKVGVASQALQDFIGDVIEVCDKLPHLPGVYYSALQRRRLCIWLTAWTRAQIFVYGSLLCNA